MINSEKNIQKRDGRYLPFDESKIFFAVQKALEAVGKRDDSLVSRITEEVVGELDQHFFSRGNFPQVEEIQDCVEKILVKQNEFLAAKAYILYREKRAEMRDFRKNLLDGIEVINEYISEDDWRVKENSNMSYSLQGLNLHISSKIIANYWLRKIYPLDVRMAHEEGELHVHDLGVLGPYCVGWDLEDLLLNGFKGAPGKVESSPPCHFRSALGQIVNFFYTLQGEAAGAQAFSNFDTLLAPFIRFDNLDFNQVKQALQEFVFNLNVPTRVGFQTPFTNITMDLNPPSVLKEKPAIIGGKEMDESYGDFQVEMDMLNRAFSHVMMEGDAKGRIFTFPIPTYNISTDFDWESDSLQSLWEMTAKYGVPYFANFVHSDMKPEDARSMCCRLRLDNRELWKRGGGLFGSSPLTGSVGVVTINLPRIGYNAKDKTTFFNLLDRLIKVAVVALEIKRKNIERFSESGLYPYSKYYLRSIKKSWGKYWNFHFATIGIVGMNEALLNFMGKPITDPEARQFALEIMDHLRDQIQDIQEKTGNMYNLEATPAESASFRLATIDKKKYPQIITSGHAKPYYTNSVHPPVDQLNDIYAILQHQDELQSKFTGGTVVHLYLGENIKDWRLVRKLTRKITDRFKLPYFSFTPTFSISPTTGYIAGSHRFDPRPQKEEDLDSLGVEILVSQEELQTLPAGSYKVVSGEQLTPNNTVDNVSDGVNKSIPA